MSDDALAALVALARLTGLGLPGLADRIETTGAEGALDDELGTTATLFPASPEPLLEQAHADIERWHTQGIRLISVLNDDEYPENLREVHDRPALIFAAGRLADDDRRAIAVVGTRAPSETERDAAAAIARDLVAAEHTVVSGLAAGVDAAAHRAAVEHRGRTLAVIGTGHLHTYPRENAGLQRELAATHAVLSPFWPETSPSPDGFRCRSGVMSGLSRGTVIVAAGARSGTRVQARLALAHGRPVFLLPGLLAQKWAAELARRPNVHVVESAAEIIRITDGLTEPLDQPEAS